MCVIPASILASMPKRFIKRYMPHPHKIRDHKHLQWFGSLLHDQNLWHLNRRSVSGAMFWGTFVAFIPLPFQMIMAAAAAVVARVNLPISVGLVWITNPLTMGPIYYAAYKIGAWILRLPPYQAPPDESTFDWIWNELGHIWQPFLLGNFLLGTGAAIAGYVVTRYLWRRAVIHNWHKRQRLRAAKISSD